MKQNGYQLVSELSQELLTKAAKIAQNKSVKAAYKRLPSTAIRKQKQFQKFARAAMYKD